MIPTMKHHLTTSQLRLPSLHLLQERHQRLQKPLWIINIRRMPRPRHNSLLTPRDFLHHVLAGRNEGLVLLPHNHNTRHPDVRQTVEDITGALRQHAPGRERETARIAVRDARSLRGEILQPRETVGLKVGRLVVGSFVPGVAGRVFLEPGARVDDQQGLDALRMHAVEGETHVPAETESAHDGFLVRRHVVEQGQDVRDRVGFAVLGLVVGIGGVAVAAHVPDDELEVLRQRGDLLRPHA